MSNTSVIINKTSCRRSVARRVRMLLNASKSSYVQVYIIKVAKFTSLFLSGWRSQQITKLHQILLRSCLAQLLQSCVNNITKLRVYYKVAQLNNSTLRTENFCSRNCSRILLLCAVAFFFLRGCWPVTVFFVNFFQMN